MLTINHTESGGTIIDGTAKGDGSAAILKTNGWRWSRLLGAWYVPYSRDVAPKSRIINGTAAALRAANFDVTVTIQSGIRDMTEVESDRAARQSDRVDALDAKAERLTDAAESAHGKAREMSNRYPLGQPILVGHHSERRHRRDIERAHDAADAAREADRAAEKRRPRPTPPATPQTTGTTPLASPAESTPSRRTSAKHIATSTDTPAPSRPRRPESGSPRPPRPRQAPTPTSCATASNA
ncbi:DUF3560 domain-containing protein [Rhodococcus hoagii]|nr:DUF3560 domain-containing protein [Prescottella equi]